MTSEERSVWAVHVYDPRRILASRWKALGQEAQF